MSANKNRSENNRIAIRVKFGCKDRVFYAKLQMMGEKPVIFWMDWIKVLSLRTVIMNTDLLEKLDNPYLL